MMVCQWRFTFRVVLIFCIFLFTAGAGFTLAVEEGGHAHEDSQMAAPHDHDAMQANLAADGEESAAKVNVVERLGEFADLDTRFINSKGEPVILKQLFDKPVVLLPIYFECTSICSFLQADLANALNQVQQVPGKDFNVVNLSFSDDEDHILAAEAKENYLHIVKRPLDAENWFYLTGTAEEIRKLTDSLGYFFIKQKPHLYIHPSVLVVLGQDGKIIRYLYGPGFLPFDLGMAVSEAEKGEPGISIKRRVLSFCFNYDPEKKTYVFSVFRITGTAVLTMLAFFLVFLLYPGRKKNTQRHRDTS